MLLLGLSSDVTSEKLTLPIASSPHFRLDQVPLLCHLSHFILSLMKLITFIIIVIIIIIESLTLPYAKCHVKLLKLHSLILTTLSESYCSVPAYG